MSLGLGWLDSSKTSGLDQNHARSQNQLLNALAVLQEAQYQIQAHQLHAFTRAELGLEELQR
jgi:hypothetical protein